MITIPDTPLALMFVLVVSTLTIASPFWFIALMIQKKRMASLVREHSLAVELAQDYLAEALAAHARKQTLIEEIKRIKGIVPDHEPTEHPRKIDL